MSSTSQTAGYSIYAHGRREIWISKSATIAADSSVSFSIQNVTNPDKEGRYCATIFSRQWETNIDGDYSQAKNMSSYFSIGTSQVVGTVLGDPVRYAPVNIHNANWSIKI